jgi:hypothetical protein
MSAELLNAKILIVFNENMLSSFRLLVFEQKESLSFARHLINFISMSSQAVFSNAAMALVETGERQGRERSVDVSTI